MLDIGFVELLVFVLPVWCFAAFVAYWIIRLGVRHGTLDAYRIDRTDQRIADMKLPRGAGRASPATTVPDAQRRQVRRP
jgi:hypothetical protein